MTSSILSNSLAHVFRSYLAGLTLSTAGSSATFSVAAGVAADSTNALVMNLGSSISKTTSAFSAGTGNGALDTGSIAASTWYHVHLIAKAGGTNVDVLVSLSATAPTLPSGYTLFRRIGSLKTNGSSQWTGFTQIGDRFYLSAPIADISGVTPTSSATVARALSNMPAGIALVGILQVSVSYSGTAPADARGYFWPTAFGTTPPAVVSGAYDNLATVYVNSAINEILVDATQKINTQMSSASANVILSISTLGWIDRRGLDN